ncbi:hypothetical protein [Sphingopyxis sp.]|uniref:hypothetical protein n=1 Tax=Sphingopyxis sp. TaxID=1908224 RepID=UPI002D799176|nr:hypothetical protein [Sphingopyxis sp.]HET6523085.1 hypothetical protein [Sphingopyxis sp.]
MIKHIKMKWILTAAVLAYPSVAHAQTAAEEAEQPDGSNDIIVTATRQSTGAQSVPIALTAIGGAELARQGVASVQDLQQLAPSLYAVSVS